VVNNSQSATPVARLYQDQFRAAVSTC